MRLHVVDMDRGIPEIEPPLDYALCLQCRASGCSAMRNCSRSNRTRFDPTHSARWTKA